MPSASATIAMTVNPGAFASMRLGEIRLRDVRMAATDQLTVTAEFGA